MHASSTAATMWIELDPPLGYSSALAVSAWLATELTEERHRRRVAKIEAIEREYLK